MSTAIPAGYLHLDPFPRLQSDPDDSARIQRAVDRAAEAGGGTLCLPVGELLVGSTIQLRSGVRIEGVGTMASVLRTPQELDHEMAFFAANHVNSVSVHNVCIDNLHNFPDRNEHTLYNGPKPPPRPRVDGFLLTECDNVEITGCHIVGTSGNGILHSGVGLKRALIRDNLMEYSNWAGKSIAFYSNNVEYDEFYSRNIVIESNIIRHTGIARNVAGIYTGATLASTDAIHLDDCMYCTVRGNILNDTSGCGIRIEQSQFVNVSDNNIKDSDAPIIVYHHSEGVTVTGNIIEGFGRLPLMQGVREYGGKHYLLREFITDLPENPAQDPRFEPVPYSLEVTDSSFIQPYHPGNAYDGSVNPYTSPESYTDPANYAIPNVWGLLPFRGGCGIAIAQSVIINCSITNNIIKGNQAVDSQGKYIQACDFGIGLFNAVNSVPSGGKAILENVGVIANNYVTNVARQPITRRAFIDPVGQNGPIGCDFSKMSGNIFFSEQTGAVDWRDIAADPD
jgi:parallel beta-helix repeat protein